MTDIRERLRKAADNIESRFDRVFEGVTCAEAADIIDNLVDALERVEAIAVANHKIVQEALKAVKGEQQ